METKIKNVLLFIWYFAIGGIFRCLPIDNNKLLFESYHGKGFGDNSKYIAEEVHRNLKTKDCKMIWLLKKGCDSNLPEYIKPVYRGTMKELYHIATSKIWVDNARKHYGIKKRKNQYYIQAWHGCVPLKKIEGDVEEKLENEYIKSAKQDSKNADLMISNSRMCTEMYRRAFWYTGEILECGTPRMDVVYEMGEAQKKKIKKKLGISEELQIVLYAPTFRAHTDESVYGIDYESLIKALSEKFDTNWCVLKRFHPNMSDRNAIINIPNVLDVTSYSDMYELLAVADILITDYSSTMFEMSYVNRMVFLFALDIDKYSNERGYYFRLEELPFPIATSNEELVECIAKFDKENYLRKLNEFKKRINVIETGNASKKVASRIMEFMNS